MNVLYASFVSQHMYIFICITTKPKLRLNWLFLLLAVICQVAGTIVNSTLHLCWTRWNILQKFHILKLNELHELPILKQMHMRFLYETPLPISKLFVRNHKIPDHNTWQINSFPRFMSNRLSTTNKLRFYLSWDFKLTGRKDCIYLYYCIFYCFFLFFVLFFFFFTFVGVRLFFAKLYTLLLGQGVWYYWLKWLRMGLR